MLEKDTLLSLIAQTIRDYRQGELDPPSVEHVGRWVYQFPEEVRLPLLREVNHLLATTYYSKEKVSNCIDRIIASQVICGDNAQDFWKSANFLSIQKKGESQEAMLMIMGERLKSLLNLDIKKCGSDNGPFIYLDDFLFSGYHLGNDLDPWIKENALDPAHIIMLFLEVYSLGIYQVINRINTKIAESKKNITYRFYYGKKNENRMQYRKKSEVLWPSELPKDLYINKYLELDQKFPFKARPVGNSFSPFSSEEGRQLLEKEFLLAGLKIRSFSENPNEALRPLGFSSFGLGFGSMIVTYRNCPNNCPLALWWGNPKASKSSPLSKWYPLLQRKINGEEY